VRTRKVFEILGRSQGLPDNLRTVASSPLGAFWRRQGSSPTRPVIRWSSATASTCSSQISQCTSHYSNKHLLRSLFQKSPCKVLCSRSHPVKFSVPEVTLAHHSSMDKPTSLDLQATLTQHTEVKTVIVQPLAAVITTVVYNCEILLDNTDSVFCRAEKGRRKERLERL